MKIQKTVQLVGWGLVFILVPCKCSEHLRKALLSVTAFDSCRLFYVVASTVLFSFLALTSSATNTEHFMLVVCVFVL